MFKTKSYNNSLYHNEQIWFYLSHTNIYSVSMGKFSIKLNQKDFIWTPHVHQAGILFNTSKHNDKYDGKRNTNTSTI